MKYFIAIIITATFLNKLEAQNDPASVKFIRSVVTDNEKILYIDSLQRYALTEMRKTLSSDTLYDDPEEREHIITIFTKEEGVYIRHAIDSIKNFTWSKKLFEKSQLIPTDTVNKIFSHNNDLPVDGWSYFYTYFGKGFHEFSRPIFLRGQTMCLFYSAYHCGWLCAEGDFAIYIREGNKWVKKYVLYSWMS